MHIKSATRILPLSEIVNDKNQIMSFEFFVDIKKEKTKNNNVNIKTNVLLLIFLLNLKSFMDIIKTSRWIASVAHDSIV